MADGMMQDPFAPLEEACQSPVRTSPAPAQQAVPAARPLPEQIRHKRYGAPTAIWSYRNADGELLFAVCRFEPPGQRKQVLPYSCGPYGWKWKAPLDPRPLYGLDRLAARLDAPVLVVEGEKTADAAAQLFPDYVALCWQGGAQAWGKADWSPLQGRTVIFWPDADTPGQRAVKAAAKAAKAAGAKGLAIVAVPSDWPENWDVADFGREDRPQPDGLTREILQAMLGAATAQQQSVPAAYPEDGEPSPDPRGRPDLLEAVMDLRRVERPA